MIDPQDIDPDTGRPYANYSSPALDTSLHDQEMAVDDADDCPPHCCCCGDPGERCCDCGEVPVRASEVLRFLDYFAGQETTAEDVRDFVQLAARGVGEGKTRKDFANDDRLASFISWCEEVQPSATA